MRTWPTHGRPRNEGAWKTRPLRRIVARDLAGSRTVIETLECGHAIYQPAPIRKHPSAVKARRCPKCPQS